MTVDRPAVVAGAVFAATEVMAATPYASDLSVGSGVLTAAVGVVACGAIVKYDRRYAAPAVVAGTTWTLAGSWATWTLATGPGVVNTIGGLTATGLVTLACWGARWTRAGDPLTAAKVETERSKAALNLAKLRDVESRVDVTEEEDTTPWEPLAHTLWEPRADVPATADPIDLGGGVVVPLEGGHILLAGATGAGKSVVMAAVIADLLPRAHLRILVIDPKGDRLLGCLVGTNVTVVRTVREAVEAMEGVVSTMRLRGDMVTEWAQAYVRGEIEEPPKVWAASAEHPWDVIVVDEFTDLAGTPVMDLLDEVARKSRSLGQTVVMGTQSVGADLFATARSKTGGGLRSQFSTLICGRVNNITEADKLFGSGQAKQGWDASRLPGKGHVLVQSPSHTEPEMRRVPEVTMPVFADVVRRYTAPVDASESTRGVVVPGPRVSADAPMDTARGGTQGERVLLVLDDGAWWKVGDLTVAADLSSPAVTRAVLARLRKAREIESDGAGLFRACVRDSNVTRGPWPGA